jgi:ferric-dicitrate binding protein FerR (iron transport regulator)
MATRPAAHRHRMVRVERRIGAALACGVLLAAAAFAYWRLDPAAASRAAYAACAGNAPAALHAQDARVRQQAVDTLVGCAAQR